MTSLSFFNFFFFIKKKGSQTFIRFSMISLLFTATSTTIQRLKRPA